MVEIGGRPILWHIMKHYAHYGFKEFVVALGYKGEVIKRYFLDYHSLSGSMTRRPRERAASTAHDRDCEDWTVHLVDTGLDTITGGRVQAAASRWLERRARSCSPTATASATSTSTSCSRSTARTAARHGHRRAPAGALRRPRSSTATWSRSSPRSRRSARAGSTAASWCFEPAVFDYLDGDDSSLEARRARAAGRGRPARGLPPRRLLAVHGHAARQAASSRACGSSGSAPWKVWAMSVELLARSPDARHRRHRPGRRLAGAAPARRRAPTSSAWSATGCRRASSSARGSIERVNVVRGDVRDQALLERVLGEYEIDTVFHLAAQTIVGIANRNPVSTFETNIAGTWALLEACRRSPTVKQIVVASSDKAYGDHESCRTTRTTPLAGPPSLRRQQVVRGPDRADATPTTYGLPVVDHPLRQLLRRRRPQLEPHRARARSARSPRRAAGHPLRRPVRPRLLLRRGRRRRLHAPRRAAGRATATLRGEAFNFSNEIQVTVLDLVGRILALMDSTLEPDVRNEATQRDPPPVPQRRARRATMLGWRPSFTLDEGLRAHDRLVPRLPRRAGRMTPRSPPAAPAAARGSQPSSSLGARRSRTRC